jgi:hypothetical protein
VHILKSRRETVIAARTAVIIDAHPLTDSFHAIREDQADSMECKRLQLMSERKMARPQEENSNTGRSEIASPCFKKYAIIQRESMKTEKAAEFRKTHDMIICMRGIASLDSVHRLR